MQALFSIDHDLIEPRGAALDLLPPILDRDWPLVKSHRRRFVVDLLLDAMPAFNDPLPHRRDVSVVCLQSASTEFHHRRAIAFRQKIKSSSNYFQPIMFGKNLLHSLAI